MEKHGRSRMEKHEKNTGEAREKQAHWRITKENIGETLEKHCRKTRKTLKTLGATLVKHWRNSGKHGKQENHQTLSGKTLERQ